MATKLPERTSPERILALREARGLTQMELCQNARLAPMTLRKLETVACDRVDFFILQRLASALRVKNVNDLLEAV